MVDEPGAPAGSHGTGVTVACRYYGRDFTTDEMALIRALITTEPTRAAIARAFCQRTGWLKPDGGLKFMMAKVTMLAMHRDGLITLPPPRQRPSRRKPIVFGQDTEPPLFAPPTTLDEARPLDVSIVVSGTREGKLWNEFVARYHYLGYTTLVGAQMRYAVHDRNGWPVAMLGFSTRRMETRSARHPHRMDTRGASEEPATRHRQPALPHPALDSSRQSRVPHPRHHATTPAR